MKDSSPDGIVLEHLGQALARVRLERNQAQAELAREAGVSRATVQRLERGASVQLTHLVRVLRALGLDLDLASRLAPTAPVRPLEELRRSERKPLRRRARRKSDAPSPGPWTWGPES